MNFNEKRDSALFDNSVPPGHNSSLSFRMNKGGVFAGSVRKKLGAGR